MAEAEFRMMPAREDLERFYALIGRLIGHPAQGRPLRELPERQMLPMRGIYFFMEPNEMRHSSPAARIVRVGTHAVSRGSRSTLHGRLKQHLGTRAGGGNHRGSIFRRHLGDALLIRERIESPSWGIGSSASRAIRNDEAACEKLVSEYIGAMPVLWVDVPDDPSPQSERAFIERNSIALLSNRLTPTDGACKSWLGRFSPRREIRESALWNVNFVEDVHDPRFLDMLELHMDRML